MMALPRHYTPNTSQYSRTQHEKRFACSADGHGRQGRCQRMSRTATDPYPMTSPSTGDGDIVIKEEFNPYKNIPAAAGPSSRIDEVPDSAETAAAKNQISESPKPTAPASEDQLILTGNPINPYKNVPAAATPTFSFRKEPDGAERVPSVASTTGLAATSCPATYSASPTDGSTVSSADSPKSWKHLDPIPSGPPDRPVVTTSPASGYPYSPAATSLSTSSVLDSIPTALPSSSSGATIPPSPSLDVSQDTSSLILFPGTSLFNFPSTRYLSWTTCTHPRSTFPGSTTTLFPPDTTAEPTSLPLHTSTFTSEPTLTLTLTPTETQAPESSGPSGSQIAMYVGIPTGVLVGIGLLAFGIYRYKKKRNEKWRHEFKDNIRVIHNSSPRPGAMQGKRTGGSSSPTVIPLESLEWWQGRYEYDE